jgi:thymidylate synthase
MQAYLALVNQILTENRNPNNLDEYYYKPNRTGMPSIGCACLNFEHNMADGFPLLTTKKMGMKSVATELEFFIKGLSSKKWLQDRNCHIWDPWANPEKVNATLLEKIMNSPVEMEEAEIDALRKETQLQEDDLGSIYGVMWRDWKKYDVVGEFNVGLKTYKIVEESSIDQLANAIYTLQNNPFDRRIIVSAWNPAMLDQMALTPCHLEYQFVTTINSKEELVLNLSWEQRSVDSMLGLPYNIASYGLLLELVAKTVGMTPGKLSGRLVDCHIYKNHIETAKVQLTRTPYYPLPKLLLPEKVNVLTWKYDEFELLGYKSHDKLTYEIAV